MMGRGGDQEKDRAPAVELVSVWQILRGKRSVNMQAPPDEVFVLDDGDIRALPLRQMRSGLFGKSLEDALQSLFEDYPSILPGSQIDPASEEPPCFALLRREMPVGSWSLDHLFVDQFGVPTLVETKLLENPESRREVIGQIIEYAANARTEWASGKARQRAAEYWSRRGEDLDDVLRETLSYPDIDQLWRDFESNLEKGRIRLILAADFIRPEVRRMIEYLNSEMRKAEVLGLELRIYGEGEGQTILAPRVVGQSQAIADRRTSASAGTVWTVADLLEAYQDVPNGEAERLIALLEWAVENDCFLGSRAQSPIFGLASKTGDRIVGTYPTGLLYLFFEDYKYPGGASERDELVDELKSLSLLATEINPSEVRSGRNFSRSLSELTGKEFNDLLDILRRVCGLSVRSA
jgi:hypothetical protein